MTVTRTWLGTSQINPDDITSAVQHDTGSIGQDISNYPTLGNDGSLLRTYGSIEVFAQVDQKGTVFANPFNWQNNILFYWGVALMEYPFTDPDATDPSYFDWVEWDPLLPELQYFDPALGLNSAHWTLPNKYFDVKSQRRMSAGNSYVLRGILGWNDPQHYLTRGYNPNYEVYVGYQFSARALTQAYS